MTRWCKVVTTEGGFGLLSLVDVDLKQRYRTGRDNLVSDFYVPVLSNAVRYQRAVGYFSLGSMSLAAQGMNKLIENGGTVRLIASPQFSQEDIEALRRGVRARDDVIETALLRSLAMEVTPTQSRRLEYVSWMIAERLLEVKIAIMPDLSDGIFHEKFGLISDGRNTVGFTGSANETAAAHLRNFESFIVFRSWNHHEDSMIKELQSDFDALWSNSTERLEVFDLPKAISDGLLTVSKPGWLAAPPDPDELPSTAVLDTHYPMGRLVPPATLSLRDYQNEAIGAWFEADGRGVFELATGTGKTVTAIALAAKLSKGLDDTNNQPLCLIVVVPFLNLAHQWKREIEKFGVVPLLAVQGSSTWRPVVEGIFSGLRARSISFAAIVTTNQSFAGSSFQGLLRDLPESTLIIADEVHNLGAKRNAASLPSRARYRLGLSATPERWMDDEGTERIRGYFGRAVATKSLKEAITEGFLCPYDYYPVLIRLDEDEHDEYLRLSEKIARLVVMSGSELTADDSDGALQMLLFQRARLVGAARGKLSAVLKAASNHRQEGNVVVYCSDASMFPGIEDDPNHDPAKQLSEIVKGLNLPPVSMSAAPYTYEVKPSRRALLEEEFARGDIEALVAIRCLDEGVDIPSMRTAIIAASTTNPRQFIQRRGRVLRRTDDKTFATIYDMVVVPGDPNDMPTEHFNLERRLFRKELTRVVEFARNARNDNQVLHELLALRTAWNCLDV